MFLIGKMLLILLALDSFQNSPMIFLIFEFSVSANRNDKNSKLKVLRNAMQKILDSLALGPASKFPVLGTRTHRKRLSYGGFLLLRFS